MGTLRIHTAPTLEPITLTQFKQHCRITHYDEDSLMSSYITAARQWCEHYCERAFYTQTWNYHADEFPTGSNPIVIYRPQYASVTAFTYKDTASASQSLSASDYQVRSTGEPIKIYPALNEVWPLTDCSVNNVNFRFVCGWSTIALIPQAIKQAIMVLAAQWMKYREPIVTGMTVENVPVAVESLLQPWKVFSYA